MSQVCLYIKHEILSHLSYIKTLEPNEVIFLQHHYTIMGGFKKKFPHWMEDSNIQQPQQQNPKQENVEGENS